MKTKHHEIPLPWLLFPGLFLFIGLIILMLGYRDLAFYFAAIAVVSAVLIHKEEK